MPSYLITGVARGCGWAFLSQLSADPKNVVVGTVRDKASTDKKVAAELQDRPNVHIVQADLTDFTSLKNTVETVSSIVGGSLDYIIANAGLISAWSAYDNFNFLGQDPQRLEEDLLSLFRTNVVGNVHLFNLYLPLILEGTAKKVVTLTSGYADIPFTNNFDVEEAGPYSATKAAMDMVTAKYSAAHKKDGVLFMNISPGTVEVGQNDDATEYQKMKMGEMGARFMKYSPNFKGRSTPDEAVAAMVAVINKASIEGGYAGDSISHMDNKQWI